MTFTRRLFEWPSYPNQLGFRNRSHQFDQTYLVFHLFAGVKGGSIEFKGARAEYAGRVGYYRTLLAADVDPVAIHNYRLLTGESEEVARMMELFSSSQYVAYHSVEPPVTWKELTAWDLWVAMQYQVHHAVVLSPPCKGSGLRKQCNFSTLAINVSK